MKRRDFLKVCLLSGATATLGSPSKSLAVGSFEGYPDAMGVLADTTRCIGCRSCEAACNKEQHLPEPDLPFNDTSVFEHTRRTDEKAYTVVNRYTTEDGGGPVFRKMQCNHCNEPACLTSCFVNAYTKTKEGAVIYNKKVCVGCRTCMVACPFNIPAYSYSSAFDPVIKKCILCYDTRVKFGRPPACVEICPREVFTFGLRKDMIKLAHERIKETPDRYHDHVYGEKEVGGTTWLYLSRPPVEQIGLDTHLGNEPIISNVKEFLGMVPMVLCIWPALFSGIHLLATRNKDHHDDEHHTHSEQGDGKQ
ncbi:MAG: 4Fe-4S dicluster domain-containing protein [Oryzomonas sp.]|jgi:Fe-S-cluster-containing dehydrogenase component